MSGSKDRKKMVLPKRNETQAMAWHMRPSDLASHISNRIKNSAETQSEAQDWINENYP